MATVPFDTLKASRDLQAAGITEAHAQAIVGSKAEAFSDTVATKADVAGVKADIANRKAEMFRALWIQGAGWACRRATGHRRVAVYDADILTAQKSGHPFACLDEGERRKGTRTA